MKDFNTKEQEALINYRMESVCTQKQFSEKSKISLPTVQRIERGEPVSIFTTAKLMKFIKDSTK